MSSMPRTFISTLSASPKCLARCFSALSPATPLSNVLPFVAPGVACSASRERFGGVSFRRCLTLYVQGLAFPTASSGQSWGEATEAEVPESPPRSKMDDLSLNGPAQATPAPDMDPFVQYIVIRKDLVETLKWPLGSIISQGCHAAVAATWLHKDDVHTLQYCSPENLDNMHTVTLEVKGNVQLLDLSKKLEEAGVAHKLWVEQPENIATSLATKPYPKSQVGHFFKKLKLCK